MQYQSVPPGLLSVVCHTAMLLQSSRLESACHDTLVGPMPYRASSFRGTLQRSGASILLINVTLYCALPLWHEPVSWSSRALVLRTIASLRRRSARKGLPSSVCLSSQG